MEQLVRPPGATPHGEGGYAAEGRRPRPSWEGPPEGRHEQISPRNYPSLPKSRTEELTGICRSVFTYAWPGGHAPVGKDRQTGVTNKDPPETTHRARKVERKSSLGYGYLYLRMRGPEATPNSGTTAGRVSQTCSFHSSARRPKNRAEIPEMAAKSKFPHAIILNEDLNRKWNLEWRTKS